MNLQEILVNAGVNFAAGFSWGFVGLAEKLDDRLDIFEYAMKKEGREKLGYDDKKIKSVRNLATINRIALPATFGLLYATYSHFPFIGSVEDYAVAVPSAIAGSLIGGLVGKVFRNWRNKDECEKTVREGIKYLKETERKLGIPRDALTDVDNLDKYLLSEEQRKKIDDAYLGLENAILAGEDLSDNGKPGQRLESAMRTMYETITQENKPYTNILLNWNMKRWEKIMKRAITQREVARFYELELCNECSHSDNCKTKACDKPDFPNAAILGQAEHARVKVFVKEGDEFYTASLEWPDLKMASFENQRVEMYAPGKTNFVCGERTAWTGDYRQIAEQVLQAGKEKYSVMMARFPEKSPEVMKKLMLTMSYLPAFQEHSIGRDGGKDDEPGRTS